MQRTRATAAEAPHRLPLLRRAKLTSVDVLELQLSPDAQAALKARASAHARSLEAEARALLEAALMIEVSDDNQLEQLSVLDDTQLRQVAEQRVPAEQSERMQVLVERQQREGLLSDEAAEALRLQRYAQRTMRLRAEAAVLLKRRGHKVDSLLSPS